MRRPLSLLALSGHRSCTDPCPLWGKADIRPKADITSVQVYKSVINGFLLFSSLLATQRSHAAILWLDATGRENTREQCGRLHQLGSPQAT
jgi:hypothetical protein